MTDKYRILILGGSGFTGSALYSELQSFYDCYGTYCTQHARYGENQAYYRFDATSQSITPLLERVRPTHIISTFNAPTEATITTHDAIIHYLNRFPTVRLIYLSSVAVFDGKRKFPSYESAIHSPISSEGKKHAAVEKMLKDLPDDQYTIARLPMVLGVNAPLVFQLKQAIKHHANFEVYPNLIVSVTTIDKVCQQLHYIINRDLSGIFHLSSEDLIHHDDLFYEIASALGDKMPIFKKVYSSNDDAYLALLSKDKKLPETYRITTSEVVNACTLFDEISTLKNTL